MKEVIAFYPILIDGTITTIILTVLSAILALAISFVVGLSRISKFKIVRVLAIIYLEFFRGSSALVQMFFIYFVLPMWGIYFDALTAGVIAIGCAGAAFNMNDIEFRGEYNRALAKLKATGEFAAIIEPYGFSAEATAGESYLTRFPDGK